MALPLNLAMTAAELSQCADYPSNLAWMACHFSPCGQGLSNIPTTLPSGAMLILNDRQPIQGHSPDLLTQQLSDAVKRLECESVLLDFQRPSDTEARAVIQSLLETLPCPAAVSAGFADGLNCPVFLPPAPLHIPLSEYLAPWRDRELWLEAALCQEQVTVTEAGSEFAPRFPTESLRDGFYSEALLCRYQMRLTDRAVYFTLYDTPETLAKKLDLAEQLGVTRAVGLFQELGT